MPWATPSGPFRFSAFGTGRWPAQGWKLHVSGTGRSAIEVASRCVPILVGRGVRFKIIEHLPDVLRLNGGEFGHSQVGKFITVYPSSDADAVELASRLHKATLGLRGPDVPSDRPLRRGSLVHYRYGAFRTIPGIGDDNSESIFDPAGRIDLDARRPYYAPPTWVNDPFVASGEATPEERRNAAFLDRFVVTSALSRSVWGRDDDFDDGGHRTEPPRPALTGP